MAQTLTVTEMARNFAEYINRVSYRGDCFVLVRGNRPRGGTPPASRWKATRGTPFAAGNAAPHLSPTEATQLADDLETAREELARTEVRDPWAS